MNDAISRSAVLTIGNVRKVTEYDEAGYDMTYDAVPVEAIEALPALDVAPVVEETDIRSSVIPVKDSDEWQDRIVLADESTQVCAVYYADDSELAPVVHAEWIHDASFFSAHIYHCSACEEKAMEKSRFCPNCGAKMEEEEHDA